MRPRWLVLGIGSLLVALLSAPGVGWTAPKPGGTLRIALPGDMTFFNAHQGPAPGYETFWVWNNIFQSLLTLTPPPELKVVPELATSWEVLDDGKTYVFHLVQGVKFHDGTDFNAQAAKWNVERILDPETKSWVKPYYTDIEQVEAVDTYTLRLRLKHPSGGLPAALAGYFQGIPMASPKSYETYGKDWVRHPSGTGPYMFKEWVPGERVVLVKNPAYFKPGMPYLDTLEFRIMKDPFTASTALRSGEVDFMSRVPIRLVPILEKSKSVRVITGPDMAPTVAFLNMRSVSFFKGQQADYMGVDDPSLEALVYQWRQALDPAARDSISADIQRLIADQLYWVNVSGYPFFQAHHEAVKDFAFYDQAYFFFENVWLDK